METRKIIYDGVSLIVPIIDGCPLTMPHRGFDDFDTYCGAGKGIGDLIVPDDIFGVVISPACYIHDKMWLYCEPTWRDFHHSNSVFFHNILSIIDYFAPPVCDEEEVRTERYARAVTYYTAVDSAFGPTIFWRMKKNQELI
jgi:hypothetical protein